MTTVSRFGIATLLVGLVFPALADEYQDAVGKAFPDFQILKPSEIRLDSDMNREIYNQVKDHPGLVTGRLNSDDLTDFAALIRGSVRKQYVLNDRAKTVMHYYDGYLVVCFGLGASQYKCEKLNAGPMKIGIPHSEYLLKLPPGREFCSTLLRFRPPRPDRRPNPYMGGHYPEPGEQRRVEIDWSVEAIDLVGVGEEAIYVPQPDKTFLECYKPGA